MPAEPLTIFDPRRNFQLQGFTGRAATTTLHDSSATGVSISGIFEAAEDFAVLGLYNAYDYFNDLRQKHLARTDLSGLTLEFDIEYDHALDGAMRLDAAKYPSVSWDAITFICGEGPVANGVTQYRLLYPQLFIGPADTDEPTRAQTGAVVRVQVYAADPEYVTLRWNNRETLVGRSAFELRAVHCGGPALAPR